MKTIWIDLETTGVDKNKDQIIELSAIFTSTKRDSEKNDIFHAYSFPEPKPENFDAVSASSHNLTFEYLKDFGVSEQILYAHFKKWLSERIDPYNKKDKAVFAVFNCGFDKDFLYALFKKNGDDYFYSFFMGANLDVAGVVAEELSCDKCPMLTNFKLGTVYEHYTGKPLDGAHGATADILATMQIYGKIKKKTAQVKKILTLFEA